MYIHSLYLPLALPLMKSVGGGRIRRRPPPRVPRPAASSCDSRIACGVSSIRSGGEGTGRRRAMVSGAKKGSRACVKRAKEAEKGRRRRGRPFAPSPDDAFSDDARDGRGIYRPRGEVAITPAPGNGFFQGNRVWGLTRVAQHDMIFMKEGERPRKGYHHDQSKQFGRDVGGHRRRERRGEGDGHQKGLPQQEGL